MARGKDLLVTEREFIHRVSLITGHPKDVVKDIIKAQAEFITDELKNGIPVRVTGLGEFYTQTSNCFGGYDFAKKCVKPRVTVIRPKFKFSSTLKNQVHEHVE